MRICLCTSWGTKDGSLHFKMGNKWLLCCKPWFQYIFHLTHAIIFSWFESYRIFCTFEYYFFTLCLYTVWFGREKSEFVLTSACTSIWGRGINTFVFVFIDGHHNTSFWQLFNTLIVIAIAIINLISTTDRTV